MHTHILEPKQLIDKGSCDHFTGIHVLHSMFKEVGWVRSFRPFVLHASVSELFAFYPNSHARRKVEMTPSSFHIHVCMYKIQYVHVTTKCVLHTFLRIAI